MALKCCSVLLVLTLGSCALPHIISSKGHTSKGKQLDSKAVK